MRLQLASYGPVSVSLSSVRYAFAFGLQMPKLDAIYRYAPVKPRFSACPRAKRGQRTRES
jgi:hypothetical protein